jgi:hypothetical protein
MLKKSLSRAFFLFSVVILSMLIAACSDGGGDGGNNNASDIPDADNVSVSGAAVKGPLINAEVNVYVIDPSRSDLKGRLIGSAVTGEYARVNNIEINTRRRDQAFLIEFEGGIDHTTGEAPLISPLRTIISADALNNLQPVYATPLTNFVLAYAYHLANADQQISVEELLASVESAMAQQQDIFGFGVLDENLDLFLTAPLLRNRTAQADTLAYRMASEAFAALVIALEEQGSASAAEIINALAEDLVDGAIDGANAGTAIPALADIADVQGIITTDPAALMVPGTSTSLADLIFILAEEAEDLSPGVVVQSLTAPTLSAVIPGVDSDGDKVIDANDACPEDASEVSDRDGDSYCDGKDLFPDNGLEWADIDGDGFGDNEDACDPGLKSNYGFVDSDGDGYCALLLADAGGDTLRLNADYDDTDSAIQLVCQDDSLTDAERDLAGCGADTDGDGEPDVLDNCPAISNPGQENQDNDAFGDVCDGDRDGDGVDNGADIFPDDGSGWLDCGDGLPAATCDVPYTLFEFRGSNTQAPEEAFTLPGGVPNGELTSTDGNLITGDVHIGSAVPSPTGSVYFVLFEYEANWTINIAEKTLTVNSLYYCTDLLTDPLGLNSAQVGATFRVCDAIQVGPREPPPLTWPKFLNEGVVLSAANVTNPTDAEPQLAITDDGSTVTVVFRTGDGTENVFTWLFSY